MQTTPLKEYIPPELVEYGSVSKRTLGAPGGSSEVVFTARIKLPEG